MPLPLPLPGLQRPVFDARIGSNSFGDLPDWDLTDLYESPDCAALTADMAFAVFMDACASRYARDASYRRALDRERASGMARW